MGSNFRQFAADVNAFSERDVPGLVQEIQQKIALQGLRGVVLKTPVDTGRARANWQTTIGQPAQGTLPREDTAEESNVAIQEGAQVIQSTPAFQEIWISNNVDYIEVLEDGRSDQAPNGMLSVTFAELTSQFRRIR